MAVCGTGHVHPAPLRSVPSRPVSPLRSRPAAGGSGANVCAIELTQCAGGYNLCLAVLAHRRPRERNSSDKRASPPHISCPRLAGRPGLLSNCAHFRHKYQGDDRRPIS